MKPYSLAHLPGLPRFCGGLVGYFSYEMIHFFEPRVPNKLPPERPMAEFVIPDTLLIFDNVGTIRSRRLALAFKEDGDADALFDAATARVQDLLATLAKPVPEGSPTGKTPIRKPTPVHPPELFQGHGREGQTPHLRGRHHPVRRLAASSAPPRTTSSASIAPSGT